MRSPWATGMSARCTPPPGRDSPPMPTPPATRPPAPPRFSQADEIALGHRHVGEVHAPARDEQSADADLAADAVGPLGARRDVGADLEEAALPIVDAAAGRQALRAQPR